MAEQTLSEVLAEFALGLNFRDIPADTLTHAKQHALDLVGVSLGVSASETARTVRKTIGRLGGKAECTVIGSARKYPAPLAALANATMAHTPDFDDTHGGSIIHPSAVTVPTALATAEALGADGKSLLTALVAGYEVLLRLGLMAPGKFHPRGFHPTVVCGVFGAAVTAGKLKRLPAKTLCHALGICGSQASGILEFLADGSSTKRIHPGWASLSGMIAVMLAQDGLTGPRTVLEGRFGLLKSFVGEGGEIPEGVINNLGNRWETNFISYKPYPCCHHLMAFIDCIRALNKRERIPLEEIVQVEGIISQDQADLVCTPREAKLAPRTPYDAKFSLPYVVGVTLLRGKCGLGDFTPRAIQDKKVLELAQKVTHTISDQTGFPRVFPGWVKIKLKNGTVLEHREMVNRGGPENPLSEEEIIDKFESNALLVLPLRKVKEIEEKILNMEGLRNIQSLVKDLGLKK